MPGPVMATYRLCPNGVFTAGQRCGEWTPANVQRQGPHGYPQWLFMKTPAQLKNRETMNCKTGFVQTNTTVKVGVQESCKE